MLFYRPVLRGGVSVIQRSAVLRVISDLLFPPLCLVCGGRDELSAGGVCPECLSTLADKFGRHYCPRCGTAAGPYAANDGRCSNCRGQPWRVAGTARVGRHEGSLRDLVLAFKYRGRDELDRFFARHLATELRRAAWFDEIEALAPVPTCWHRRALGRPYVANALARETARAAGLPDLPLLRRVKRGKSQIGLSYRERVENVRGAFRMARGVKLDKAVVCLIDDVATTGATLAECARVLLRAGASKVYGAVICKQDGEGRP